MSDDHLPYDLDADDDERSDDAPAPRGRQILRGRGQPLDAEDLLRRVADLIAGARLMPLSASAMINKEEVSELLEEAIGRLPDELREARWLRKEREEYLTKMRSDGDEILAAARAHAERMVQRTEVVKAAEQRARRIIDGAQAEARRLRLECEDFCDQKLAGFEIVLERTLKMVGSGREKLQANNSSRADQYELDSPEADDYFDQPRT